MKKRSRFRTWGEYGALRAFMAVLQVLPISWGMQVAAALGVVAFWVDKRHRPIAYENLRRAFGDSMSRREIRRITLRNYIHVFRCAVDMVHLPRLYRSGTLWKNIHVRSMDWVDEVAEGGKGGIFVTGHIGNWELLGWVFAVMGYKFSSVARPLDNPLLDAYARKVREMTGQRIVPKKGAIRKLARVLREGGHVAFLIDQDARGKGVFVDFFGRKASTTPAVAALALRTGAPIITGWSRRLGGGLRYDLVMTAPIWPKATGDRVRDISRMTAEVTARIESAVRSCPEQWMWLHRRWKTRPAEEGISSRPVPEEKEARIEG